MSITLTTQMFSMLSASSQKEIIASFALPSSDLYSIATSDVIDEITSDIDLGYFLGPSTWLRGQRHHPENFDVRRVINILRKNGPSNSYKINMSLLTLCRYRIAAILRQLRIQGIVTAKPAISEEFKNVYKI